MNSPLSDLALGHLLDADEYVGFARVWWDGDGLDVVSWWSSGGNCRKRVTMTGETYVPKSSMTLVDEVIDEFEFNAVVEGFVSLGLGRFKTQPSKIALTHFDDWYGIKQSSMTTGQWLKVAGGVHSDPDAGALLDYVYQLCPMLKPNRLTIDNPDQTTMGTQPIK